MQVRNRKYFANGQPTRETWLRQFKADLVLLKIEVKSDLQEEIKPAMVQWLLLCSPPEKR
jgi:hypothetical protein